MTSSPRAAALARLALPAAVIGVVSAGALILLSVVAGALQDLLWTTLPDAFGVDPDTTLWIVGVLTATGLVVGLIVLVAPGHAGPDPATQSLVSAPLALGVIPGLAAAVLVGLAGGVSLGPENPIIAINVALAIWIGHRLAAGVPVPQSVSFAAAGTLGAMFGTPAGAALLLSEMPAPPSAPSLWDRLFGPLVAAATGSLTMVAFSQPILSVRVAAYPGAHWADLLSSSVIGVAAALLGLVLVYAFPAVHAAFHRLRNPLLALVVGGLVLGVLGAIGGRITLFKGLDEMKEIVGQTRTTGELALIIAVKLAALLVAASCGFRGGRIFPAVFVGVAIGLFANHVVTGVPISLAIASGVLGILLVVTRSGWLSLFMAVTTIGQISVLPILCIALLPAWLLVTDRPELIIDPDDTGGRASAPGDSGAAATAPAPA